VLEQLEILGREVVPALRREFEARRPPHVPSDPPTHASLVAAGPQDRHHLVTPGQPAAERAAARAGARV
jgi:hypothetical protein